MAKKNTTDITMPADWAEFLKVVQSKGVPRKVWSRTHNSLLHYHKAKLLCGLDDEMGFLRLVAAEEEMTVAIFELLKLNKDHVPHATRFTKRFKDHTVKAVLPVILEFFARDALDKIGPAFLSAGLITEDKPRLTFEDGMFHLSYPGPKGVQISAELTQATVTIGEDKDITVEAFHQELTDEVYARHSKSLKQFFQDRAARRDNLLYARDGGIMLASHSVSEWLDMEYEKSLRTLIYAFAILVVNDMSSNDGTFLRRLAGLYERILDHDLKK